MLNLSPQDDLERFVQLDQVLLDASSIIYMGRAGYLDKLASSIKLFTIKQVLAEVGHLTEHIRIVLCSSPSLSTDQSLIACARELEMAVISEDRKILNAMRQANRPYFNSLMMLNFLLFRRQITQKRHEQYCIKLEKFAWYSKEVWKYGEFVRNTINRRMSEHHGR